MSWLSAVKIRLGLIADANPTVPVYDPALEPPPLSDLLQRGLAAQRLLGDPTLAEAFAGVRKDNYDQWLASDSTVECDQLHREARALDAVAAKLRAYIGAARIREVTRSLEEREPERG